MKQTQHDYQSKKAVKGIYRSPNGPGSAVVGCIWGPVEGLFVEAIGEYGFGLKCRFRGVTLNASHVVSLKMGFMKMIM